MPQVGDKVDVNVTIQGQTLFQNLTGQIVSVTPPNVEVSVTLAVGNWPLRTSISSLRQVGPNHWEVTARVKLAET